MNSEYTTSNLSFNNINDIALYEGEKRKSKLNIERFFTYPNKDPYDGFDKFEVQLIRKKVKIITDKGIEEKLFDEEDSISFEAELSYLILYHYIDFYFKKLNISNFVYKNNFNVEKFIQASKIVGIAIIILNMI